MSWFFLSLCLLNRSFVGVFGHVDIGYTDPLFFKDVQSLPSFHGAPCAVLERLPYYGVISCLAAGLGSMVQELAEILGHF